VCRSGLWRYSRHPNYFFEWLHWWGYAALAVGSPLWWLPVTAVAAMGYFIVRVTGIPPTEAQALRSRCEAYRHYQRTTSAFVPWRPRDAPGGPR
jgi:steroid 5-alpha reductase family enzyme